MVRHRMIEVWAMELATYLDRPESDIRHGGLQAGDFPAGRSIEIAYPDQSRMVLHFAFALINRERNLAGIFTEHCGYFELPLVPEMQVSHVRRDVYHHDQDDVIPF